MFNKIGVIVVGLLCLFAISCTTVTTNIPEGCEDSLIYKLIPDPHQAGILLRLGNLTALDSGLYTDEQALVVIDQIRDVLNSPNMTYMLLGKFVSAKLAPYVVLVGELVPQFETYNIIISQCDLNLLNKHLDDQEALVRMRMGNVKT